MVVGVGAIVVTIILVKMFSNKKPKGPPKTLINSDTKIPLVLVDREVTIIICVMIQDYGDRIGPV